MAADILIVTLHNWILEQIRNLKALALIVQVKMDNDNRHGFLSGAGLPKEKILKFMCLWDENNLKSQNTLFLFADTLFAWCPLQWFKTGIAFS